MPLSGMDAAPKALAIVGGGATTVRLAEAVPTLLGGGHRPGGVVLGPGVEPVTLLEKVHWALWARLAPDKLIEPAPATEVMVPPPQIRSARWAWPRPGRRARCRRTRHR